MDGWARMSSLRRLLVRIGFALGRLRPVRDRAVLATSHADRISGNLAFIAAELGRRRPAIASTVLASRRRVSATGIGASAIDALRSGYHLATARVFIVDDYFFPMYQVAKRPGTAFVQTWHACGAFKRFGYSILDKAFGADEAFTERFPIHTGYDLGLVSAMRFAPFYAEAFRQPLGIFTSRLGIPRTDLFFEARANAERVERLRARYRIGPGRRVILYAPTFRGDRIGRARNPAPLDLPLLEQRLGADWLVLLRAHPFVGSAPVPAGGFALDVSGAPDINELMLLADVLVTDYSSAIYEFSLLERPMAFYAPDHADYERERGFYLDLARDLPGPLFETTAALADWLVAGAFDLERVKRFRADSFDVADGHASERFVDEVVLPRLAARPPARPTGAGVTP